MSVTQIPARNPAALSKKLLSMAVVSCGAVQAAAAQTVDLSEIKVEAQADADYHARSLSSPKYTQPLRDVAQSIAVVPQALIEKQNAQTLEAVLQNVAGITFNSGEGAGGVGDTINIRGFNSGQYGGANVFIDGVRDSAYYTRSELFNTEQVEVIKGSSSAAWGAGVIGGAVNLESKRARLADASKLTLGAGTADYQRLALDTNQVLDEDRGIAFRLNLVGTRTGVNGRRWSERERWGIAPTLAFGLNSDTRLDVGFEHLDDRGNYDYGLPAAHGGHLETRQFGGRISKADGVKWDSYWGYRNLDKENNRSNRFRLNVEHHFSETLSLDNQLTFAQLQRDYVVTTSEGTYLAAGSNGSGRRLVGVARHTENDTFSNQTNLKAKFETSGIQHTMVAGLEYTREQLDQKNGELRFGQQGNGTTAIDRANPPSRFVGDTRIADISHVNTESETKAFYWLDTLKFNDHWQADISARRDFWSARNNRVEYRDNEDGVLGAWTPGTAAKRGKPAQAPFLEGVNDKLFSYRASVTYKPIEQASIYIAYGNARQPASIGSSSAGGINATDAVLSPTDGQTYEIGSKWDVFDEALALSGALFRTDMKGPILVDSSNPFSERARVGFRVEGLELAAVGNVTDQWSVFATYAFMKSRIIEDGRMRGGQFASPAANETGIEVQNTPRHSASVWTTYELDKHWSLDYGVRYVGERYIGLGRAAAVTESSRALVPDYWVHNAAVNWQATPEVGLRLNLVNMFNEHYWRQYNGRGFGIPGEGRGAQLTASYTF
ncbi:TonB-dependent receptor domain-containing protein [Pseudomonas sp.]|uniref:TonB-dependent receptor n=1 Tax=Pseudomonas sp. TaxID=306 RepID=UPI0028A941E4|nr:TonB-dependent receptor [Pseudomonas sp.]